MQANKQVFTNMIMKIPESVAVLCALVLCASSVALAEDKVCFESREGASRVTQKDIGEELKNVKCSDKTGAVLWWGDPFDGTQPMGEMPIEADYTHGEAVVKPRPAQLSLYPICGVSCHNGNVPAAGRSRRTAAQADHAHGPRAGFLGPAARQRRYLVPGLSRCEDA